MLAVSLDPATEKDWPGSCSWRVALPLRSSAARERSGRILAQRAGAPYGTLRPLSTFQTNPAGAAIVVTLGPLRQVVEPSSGAAPRRYLVIAPLVNGIPGAPVQVQLG